MTVQTMRDQCDAILLGRQIRNYQFLCEPSDISTLQFGDLLKTRSKRLLTTMHW